MSSENKKTTEKNREPETLELLGSAVAGTPDKAVRCITVIGQIEGHYLLGETQKTTKYEHLIPLLIATEEDPAVKGLLLVLNTLGGDVEAGLALAELIASMKKPTASLVLGGGHSIGVPLAVSASRSFIVPSATMTLHPVRVSGTVIGAPQTVRYFKDMQDRISDFICSHSHVSRSALEKYLFCREELAGDVGTVLTGKDAVACGLIDRVGGLSDALAFLHGEIKPHGKHAAQKEE